MIGTPFESEISDECCCVCPYESESKDHQENDGDELSDHEGGVHLQPAVVFACRVCNQSDIAELYSTDWRGATGQAGWGEVITRWDLIIPTAVS